MPLPAFRMKLILPYPDGLHEEKLVTIKAGLRKGGVTTTEDGIIICLQVTV